MEANYKKIIDLIKQNDVFLVASHAHPDGDGIGSTLALGIALETMGKKVVMYNQDGVPRYLDFLPAALKVAKHIDNKAKYDVSFMVDCGQPERAGSDFPPVERRGKLICIDHHVTGGEMADVACIDEKASSTGEVVYNLLKGLGINIDVDIATNILTTIIVDTGFFRYSNTSSGTLKLASHLLEIGASTWSISKNMEERVFPEQLNLLSAAIKTIEYYLGGRLAVMVLTNQMFTHANADVEMAEEFINYPRSIDGVDVAVLIREKTDSEYKISFRSKGSINLMKIVSEFGGGGHEHAAGCTIKGGLGTVKQIVVGAVERAINAGRVSH